MEIMGAKLVKPCKETCNACHTGSANEYVLDESKSFVSPRSYLFMARLGLITSVCLSSSQMTSSTDRNPSRGNPQYYPGGWEIRYSGTPGSQIPGQPPACSVNVCRISSNYLQYFGS